MNLVEEINQPGEQNSIISNDEVEPFPNLINSIDFSDITLSAKKKSISAHRIIISAASDVLFQKIKDETATNLFFEEYSFESLDAAIKYIYHGELNSTLFNVKRFKFAHDNNIDGLFKEIKEYFGNNMNIDYIMLLK